MVNPDAGDPTASVNTPLIVSAAWRSGLSNGANVGEIIGLFFTGIFQDRYGYKKTIGGALIMMICFIFITFFAVDLGMLMAGEVLCGLSWGVFQTITTAYASEVMPVVLRCYLVRLFPRCHTFSFEHNGLTFPHRLHMVRIPQAQNPKSTVH